MLTRSQASLASVFTQWPQLGNTCSSALGISRSGIAAMSSGHCRSSNPHVSKVGHCTLCSIDQYGGVADWARNCCCSANASALYIAFIVCSASAWFAACQRSSIRSSVTSFGSDNMQFSHYPQFYSRVGFAHHYRPLTGEELTIVLNRHWHKLGLELDPDDFIDAQAVAAVARIIGGNFRLLQRLFAQIHRILKINELHTITADVVETARSTLVIGAT